jgi:hypothetical protein
VDKIKLLFGALLLLLVSGQVNAALVKVSFSGSITSFYIPIFNLSDSLDNYFSIDDLVNGYFIYDTETPDSVPSSETGHYYAAINEFVINIGFFEASSTRADIAIVNKPTDFTTIDTADNRGLVGDTLGNNAVYDFNMLFSDSTGNLFSDDGLWQSGLDLTWFDSYYANFGFQGPSDVCWSPFPGQTSCHTGQEFVYFSVDNILSTVVVPAPVPEPSILLLMLTGILGLGFTQRRKLID